MAAKRAVYITGMGGICAIGTDVQEIRESLCSGQSGIEKTQYLKTSLKFETVTGEVALSNSELTAFCGVEDGLPRTTLLAIKAAEEALYNAGIELNKELRVGIILGTTVGGMDKTENMLRRRLRTITEDKGPFQNKSWK